MKKFVVLLLLLVGAYAGLKKWSPQTLDRIAFWKSAAPAPAPAALPPAEPAPVPMPTATSAKAVSTITPTGQETPVAPASASAPGAPVAPPTAPVPAQPVANVDKTSQVIFLLYHRFEGNPGGAYSITPEVFEEHLTKLKEHDIHVIPMSDFFAWRKGEKSIPKKCAVITVDDGYVSAYDVARPILKKHGFPWTYFVYTKFVSSGGKSITWEQLAALRQDGVEIGSHSVSHEDLRDAKGKSPDAYEQWLRNEIIGSKELIEKNTGGKCVAFAYPIGGFNQKVRDIIKEAGYEAAFTAYGQRVTFNASSDRIGRYGWSSRRPQDMKQAFDFTGPVSASLDAPTLEPALIGQ